MSRSDRETVRRWGAVVLGVAVLAALVSPLIQAKPIGGTAVAVPIPGAPAVGSCVSAPGPDTADFHDRPVGAILPTYPAAKTTACDRPHIGEVVTILTNPATTVETITIGAYTYKGDRNDYTCIAAMPAYLGFSLETAAVWQRRTLADIAIVGPTQLQRDAGQRWAACVIEAIDPTYTGIGDDTITYSGSLKDSAVTGRNADVIGDCQTDDQGPARCSEPHPREVLYSTQTRTTVHRQDLQGQCLALVTTTMGQAPGRTTTPATTLYFAAANSDGQPVTTNPLPAGTLLTCGVQSPATPLAHSMINTAHR